MLIFLFLWKEEWKEEIKKKSRNGIEREREKFFIMCLFILFYSESRILLICFYQFQIEHNEHISGPRIRIILSKAD
jgi:hypothetical protein